MRVCIDIRTGLQVSCVVCPNADRCPRYNDETTKEVKKDSKKEVES